MNIDKIGPAKLGERLRTARSTANLTQEEAAKKLKIARTTLLAIEQGRRRVRPNELIALANAYKIGIKELVQESMVYVDLAAKFRRAPRSKTNNQAAEDAIRLLNRLASSMIELEERLNQHLSFHYPPEKKIFPGDIAQQAEDLALELRHRLGIGLSPIPDIVSLVESELGVRIFVRALDPSISGLFIFDPVIGPCMLINAKHPLERQVQTVAHETGHFLVTRTSPDIVDEAAHENSREEKFVSLFAMSFLMPAAIVRRLFREISTANGRFSTRHLVLMASSLNVSVEAICRRLEVLKLLPQGTFDSLKDRGLAVDAVKKSILGSPQIVPAKRPSKLILLAAEAYRRQIFSEDQLCEMLAMDRMELHNYFEALGVDEMDETDIAKFDSDNLFVT